MSDQHSDPTIDNYLRSLIIDGVSDLHFKVGQPPKRRMFGNLYTLDSEPLSSQNTEALASHIVGPERWAQRANDLEIDTSYSIAGFGRFRVNIFRQRNTISLVLRIIPFKIPSLEELGVPEIVKNIALSPRGLVLVTGMSGSGKSSTLAGMIEYINQNRPLHIITIEDPIEFLHSDNVASIQQREVGVDTNDFTSALRAVLRQDPDVILVGELRDAQSMEIALRAAETGHLVFSTLHTTDAKEAVGRFIDAFPSDQQRQIRIQLAYNLRAVISQRLLTRVNNEGLVLASEIMIVNAAIRGHILEANKLGDIVQNIAKGREQYGMQTFDQSIMELYAGGKITIEEAIANATSPNDFRLQLQQQH